jgi:hypothetical protein
MDVSSLEGAFLGIQKKAITYHPPELGYLEQELLPLAGDLLGSGSRDFLLLSGDA